MSGLHVVFGSGPTGRAVVQSLVRRGAKVRVVVRGSGERDLPAGVEVVQGDATDPAQTRRLCEGASHVYQCTNARDYHRWPEQFPPLQRGVLAGAAAHGATLVVMENLYVYGPLDGALMTEDLPLRGTGMRASTRVAMTRELEEAQARGEVKVVRVRAADLLGPHVRQSMAGAELFEAILRGAPSVRVFGDPDLPHALAFAEDVGEAMVVAGLDPGAVGQVFHAPCAPAVTPRELVALIARAAGREVPALQAPPRWVLPVLLPVLGLFVPPMRGISESTWMFYEPFVVDAGKYVRRYGVEATPLEVAVEATVRWYRGRMESGELVAAGG